MKRLRADIVRFNKDPPEFIWARYKESNAFLWSFLLAPPSDSVYGGGWYWGRLKFPHEYPFAPPAILMVTPSGRFQTNVKICLSISDFHPETWNPLLSATKVLVGVLSFMLENESTTGAVEASDDERRRLAALSCEWNKQSAEFMSIFPDFDEIRENEAKRRAEVSAKRASVKCEQYVARGDFEKAIAERPDLKESLEKSAEAKKKGDSLFRSGDYLAAVQAYSSVDDQCAARLRNRAASYEKIGDSNAVLRDCDESLAIDDKLGVEPSLKALTRRAGALEQLSRRDEAIAAYQAAIKVGGDQKKDLIERLRRLQESSEATREESAKATTNNDEKKKKKKKRRSSAKGAPAEEDDDATVQC